MGWACEPLYKCFMQASALGFVIQGLRRISFCIGAVRNGPGVSKPLRCAHRPSTVGPSGIEYHLERQSNHQMKRNDTQQARLKLWRERVIAHTQTLVAKAGHLTGRKLPLPAVHFDLRGQTAGQLRIEPGGQARIRYNAALLLRYEENFVARTVPHEVAHYAAFLCYGRRIKPHGPEWQQLVQALGGDRARCHEYDTEGLRARRTRWFAYHCRCGEHALSSIRHNRICRGTRYLCRRCGEPLRAGPALHCSTPDP